MYAYTKPSAHAEPSEIDDAAEAPKSKGENMNAANMKAFDMIFGRSAATLVDARIDSVVASVSVALKLASERNPTECDRLIRELDALAAKTAMKLGAL